MTRSDLMSRCSLLLRGIFASVRRDHRGDCSAVLTKITNTGIFQVHRICPTGGSDWCGSGCVGRCGVT